MLVDLRLLLPGGMNGGIKPGFFGLFSEVRRLAGSSLRCTFLTNTWSHGDLAPLRLASDRAICAYALEGRPVEPGRFGSNDEACLELGRSGLPSVEADVYYNPLCEELPDTIGMPTLVLHADVLHRDMPDALNGAEVQRREVFFRSNCRRATRIQTISKFSKGRIEACFPDSIGKVFVTHLPVIDQVTPPPVDDRPPVSGNYFLYPANFWPHKNHRFLLDAYAELIRSYPNSVARLVLTGADNHAAKDFMSEVSRQNLADKVLFLGHLAPDEFGALFRSATALVFPSCYEGFGIPPVEAMAAGVPVICSTAGSLPEIVQHGGLMLPLSDHTVWAEAMHRVASQSELRKELRERGRKVADAHALSFEAETLKSVLFELADSSTGEATSYDDIPTSPKPPETPPAAPGNLMNLPNWNHLLAGNRMEWMRRNRAADGPRILIATTVGGGTAAAMSAVESLLAVALTWRGAKVEILLCDQQLPACKSLEWVTQPAPGVVASGQWNQGTTCAECWATGRYLFEPLGLPIHRLSGQLFEADRREAIAVAESATLANVAGLKRGNRPIGEHAMAGTLRYFARGDLGNDPMELKVLRRYVEASVLVDIAAGRVMESQQPDLVLTSHGLYVPYGGLQALASDQGRRFVTWNIGYRRRSLIFSEGETYHHSLQSESVENWENGPWNETLAEETRQYLKSRLWGRSDWIWFFEQPHENIESALVEKGVDLNKPIISALTNVIWDAQLHYPANAYPSMMLWLEDTVRWFESRPHLQLVVRVHPAERKGSVPSRQKVVAELQRRWPRLPSNVFIFDAEEQVSTYALAEASDTVLLYGTKTGVELAARGIPVIVGGEAWVRGKGITADATSPEHYHTLLAALPRSRRLDPEVEKRALQYAHHFFFRRMIPLQVLEPAVSGWPPFHIPADVMKRLDPGKDAGLDCVLDGILAGREFCFDGEWERDAD